MKYFLILLASLVLFACKKEDTRPDCETAEVPYGFITITNASSETITIKQFYSAPIVLAPDSIQQYRAFHKSNNNGEFRFKIYRGSDPADTVTLFKTVPTCTYETLVIED